jgi:K+ transporter
MSRPSRGTAVFPHPTKPTAPLALRADVESNHVLHERVVIVSVVAENVPHVPPSERLAHNAASPASSFHLPVERTVVMGSRIEL